MRRWLAVLAIVMAPVVASAECGWLLMLPTTVGVRPDVEASLANWEQNGAYDSARECEATRSAVLTTSWEKLGKQYATGALMKRVAAGEYSQLSKDEQAYVKFLYGRCLPVSVVPIK